MTTAPEIPDGPIDEPPTGFRLGSEREAILRDTLAAAGVQLGTYDDFIVSWFAAYADWPTFATVTSWIKRAGAAS